MKPKVRYLCINCGTLYQTVEEAKECCPPEEVYLCGRRGRFHFDEGDAKRCKEYKERLATCLNQYQ